MTGKELFDLSERFQEKCGKIIDSDGGECVQCAFKSETGKFECPEFFFKSIDQAYKVMDFINEDESELLELGIQTPYTFDSPEFSSCTFTNCTINTQKVE